MYIHGFDGSWLKHPFWRSRFLLNSPTDLATLLESDVEAVFVDDEKGLAPEPDQAAPSARRDSVTAAGLKPSPPIRQLASGGYTIDNRASDKRDEAEARKTIARSKGVVTALFNGVRLGKSVRAADVISVVEDITQSVKQNPAAFIRIAQLKNKDEYTYMHSVAVCALMVNFGRQLGLAEGEVRRLGLAGLLHDVGKMAVPDAVLNKPGRLEEKEFEMMRAHPRLGHDLLVQGEDVPDEALDVCLHHHEKVNGTGYPSGLSGAELSLAARMGAICDVYDALTSNRIYKTASTPAEAVLAMSEWRGHFDPELLFKFFQSINVFPVGMLVRMRSNQLGVVLDNGKRASRPKVRLFYAIMDDACIRPTDTVVANSLAGDQIVGQESPASWGFHDWPMMLERIMSKSWPLQNIAA